MNIDALTIGTDPPREVNVLIEVPIGGEPIKYEMDKASGALMVDRFLYTAMRYPGNYGFVPHTLSGDGDPCDVIVANTRAIVPGAIMSCRIVGVLIMEDEHAEGTRSSSPSLRAGSRSATTTSRTTPTSRRSRSNRSSTSLRTTRISSRESGSRSRAGGTRRKRGGCCSRGSSARGRRRRSERVARPACA